MERDTPSAPINLVAMLRDAETIRRRAGVALFVVLALLLALMWTAAKLYDVTRENRSLREKRVPCVCAGPATASLLPLP